MRGGGSHRCPRRRSRRNRRSGPRLGRAGRSPGFHDFHQPHRGCRRRPDQIRSPRHRGTGKNYSSNRYHHVLHSTDGGSGKHRSRPRTRTRTRQLLNQHKEGLTMHRSCSRQTYRRRFHRPFRRSLRPLGGLDTHYSSSFGDTGSATVLTLSAFLVLGTFTGVVLAVSMTAVCRQRAAGAADMAALAAAGDPSGDPESMCGRAHAIGFANRSRVLSCRISGDTVEIAVAVDLPGALAGLGPLVARARAGPANSAGSDRTLHSTPARHNGGSRSMTPAPAAATTQ